MAEQQPDTYTSFGLWAGLGRVSPRRPPMTWSSDGFYGSCAPSQPTAWSENGSYGRCLSKLNGRDVHRRQTVHASGLVHEMCSRAPFVKSQVGVRGPIKNPSTSRRVRDLISPMKNCNIDGSVGSSWPHDQRTRTPSTSTSEHSPDSSGCNGDKHCGNSDEIFDALPFQCSTRMQPCSSAPSLSKECSTSRQQGLHVDSERDRGSHPSSKALTGQVSANSQRSRSAPRLGTCHRTPRPAELACDPWRCSLTHKQMYLGRGDVRCG